MRLSTLLALPWALTTLLLTTAAAAPHSYNEQLHLKPLPRGALYAGFNFTSTTPLTAYEDLHFRYFPRSLGQILQYTHAAELHLRFALGRWDEQVWGDRPRGGTREGGTGVEIWAWIQADTDAEAHQRWNDLVNSLSGLFCASLNFIDQTKTTQPVLTFQPEGELRQNGSSNNHLMHGMLPHEVVCTENLTPLLKLLPCKGKAGISSLLDGHKVFDADWQAMAIDVRPVLRQDAQYDLEITQTVDMVVNLERSMRPRDDPIPRPPPIESIECDDKKPYNSHDTCYPKNRPDQRDWSLSAIFGRAIQGSCRLSDDIAAADIILETEESSSIETSAELITTTSTARHYHLTDALVSDLKAVASTGQTVATSRYAGVQASRQITGYGQERGGMHVLISNPSEHPQQIVYMESLPWFLRPYMHTLTVSGATIEKMFYVPAKDRQRGTQLELLLSIPPRLTVVLKYDFDKAILRYTEYPPDANRGFDVAPALIRVLPSAQEDDGQSHYLRTTSLLLPLPTPDFSMPYNVIILTSTVIALGFGSIFNLLTRRFVLREEVPTPPLVVLITKIRAWVKARSGAVVGTSNGGDAASISGARVQQGTSKETAPGGNSYSKEAYVAEHQGSNGVVKRSVGSGETIDHE